MKFKKTKLKQYKFYLENLIPSFFKSNNTLINEEFENCKDDIKCKINVVLKANIQLKNRLNNCEYESNYHKCFLDCNKMIVNNNIILQNLIILFKEKEKNAI